VREADSAIAERWIEGAAGRWPDARVAAIKAIKGDASARRFWRVSLTPDFAVRKNRTADVPATAIAVDLGPDDLPAYARALGLVREPLTEPPWLNVQRFLKAIGAGVPELYTSDAEARMLLVEDVGELPLFLAAEHADAGDIYRLAIDELLLLHIDGTLRLGADCIAVHIAYDERLFRYELEEFVEFGLPEVAPTINSKAIAPELDQIASELGRLPRVFSHRDYHGHNLYLQMAADGGMKLRVIDFQDALMAPATQDLAVLLTTRDTSRIIPERVEQRLLDYYFAGSLRRGVQMLPFDQFMESYWRCVLQHALKVIGRFIKLERQGKSGYAAFIPYALAQARRSLGRLDGLAQLRGALAA
jgi:hypothetical protein